MKPRRLQSDTIFSINSAGFASAIGWGVFKTGAVKSRKGRFVRRIWEQLELEGAAFFCVRRPGAKL